jgi:hypothetical protein
MERQDPDAEAAVVAALRRMTPEEKLKAVINLYWTARRLKAFLHARD